MVRPIAASVSALTRVQKSHVKMLSAPHVHRSRRLAFSWRAKRPSCFNSPTETTSGWALSIKSSSVEPLWLKLAMKMTFTAPALSPAESDVTEVMGGYSPPPLSSVS